MALQKPSIPQYSKGEGGVADGPLRACPWWAVGEPCCHTPAGAPARARATTVLLLHEHKKLLREYCQYWWELLPSHYDGGLWLLLHQDWDLILEQWLSESLSSPARSWWRRSRTALVLTSRKHTPHSPFAASGWGCSSAAIATQHLWFRKETRNSFGRFLCRAGMKEFVLISASLATW